MGYKYDPDSKRQRRFALPICPRCGRRTRRGIHKSCTPPPSLAPEYPEPTTIEEAYKTPIFYLSDYWKNQLRQTRA